MIATLLHSQLCSRGLAVRLRMWSAAFVAGLAATVAIRWNSGPVAVVEGTGWMALLGTIITGACLTGWRVAQFPKTRTAEFYLMVPASDWQILGGEVLGGMLRTAAVAATMLPLLALLKAAGWITLADAAALLAIPLAAGWLAGIGLAVVAFEPRWVRRLAERMLLGLIVAYLVLFGLAGNSFLPWALRTWYLWTGSSAWSLTDVGAVWRYFNPFRILGAVGHADGHGLWLRLAATAGLMLALSALGCWRLACRLRRHYLEENYGAGSRHRQMARPIGENPLAWWTAQRVLRFRGHVNLYLMWCVVGMYAAWLFMGDRWPAWLGSGVMRRIAEMGGEAMLGVACLQLAVVGVAFLDGLWDSNLRQRLSRLELLLVSPLQPRQYLTASLIAGWTRGRGYLLAMLVVWIATAAAGRIAWWTCLALCLLSLNYIALVLSLAFRNFGRIADDRAAVCWGLALSIGPPLLAWGLHTVGSPLSLATPLGAIYWLTLPAGEQAAWGLDHWRCAALITASTLFCAVLTRGLLLSSLGQFERTIRDAFARHITAPSPGQSG
ncbi:MAG: hypothetical protein AB7O62_05850 [Pirellulales bacterium]